MSKPNKRRYKLSTVRAQYVEAVGGSDVEVELNDGSMVTFPHPLFAPDTWTKAVDEAENHEEKARAVLGEQYEQFRDAGNEDHEITLLFMAITEDSRDQVRKRPTRL
ncbi:hypothetical protein ACFV0R_19100 [Streptomyces sp. NPDC059578]|uniref:hypothetical protein n=1 Tax=Streptomyces sp. NPDC059578 TaxID=3346874 RepID=UPI00369DE943